MDETLLLELTIDIVGAYVSKNQIPAAELPELIARINSSLLTIGQPALPSADEQKPAVNEKRFVHDDHIVCLHCGGKFKSMKRHLTRLGMTPDEYRAQWGLSFQYPMVAPNYSDACSAMAERIGLGRKAGKKAP
jgi:predicted transcriptional regulator